jgi:4-amino-4-deoxy-L-arabinose transferase-like glycosyltransferase
MPVTHAPELPNRLNKSKSLPMAIVADRTELAGVNSHRGPEQRALTLRVPEQSSSERIIALLIFGAAFGYLCLFRNYTNLDCDEGIILQGAQRILDGQVLYRDFFSFYTPGSYYLLALLFKLFGSSMLVARTALCIYGGIFSVLTYLIARRVCERWSSILAAYLVAFCILPNRFAVLHNWDSTLFAYLTVYCAILLLQRPHWLWSLAMGTAASVTVLLEQSKGVGLVAGLATGCAILFYFGVIRFRLQHIAAGLTGLAWPVVAVVAYFAAERALPQMMTGLLWPIQHYSSVNTVAFGYIPVHGGLNQLITDAAPIQTVLISLILLSCWLISALPLLAPGILMYSALQLKRIKSGERLSYYILCCSSIAGLLLSVLVTRKDFMHLLHIAPVAFLILAWIMDGKEITLQITEPLRPVLSSLLLIVFSALGLMALAQNAAAQRRVNTPRGVLRVAGKENALPYLTEHTTPGDTIFVYPYRPLYYFLTATSNPTGFELLQLGFHTPEEFAQALNSVRTQRPRVVLYQSSYFDDIAFGFPSTPLSVLAKPDPLTRYVAAEYRVCAALTSADSGNFLFMVSRDSACPSTTAVEHVAGTSQSTSTRERPTLR